MLTSKDLLVTTSHTPGVDNIEKCGWVFVRDCESELFIDAERAAGAADAMFRDCSFGFRQMQSQASHDFISALGMLGSYYYAAIGQGTLDARVLTTDSLSVTHLLLLLISFLWVVEVLAYCVPAWAEYDAHLHDVLELKSRIGFGYSLGMLVLPPLLFADIVKSAYRHSAWSSEKNRWSVSPSNEYAAFLSHYKQEAATDARYMKTRLIDMLGAPVFLDSDDLMDLSQLCVHGFLCTLYCFPCNILPEDCCFYGTRRERVARSDVLVLFLTTNLLTRPWCLIEILTALQSNVPIVAVRVAGNHPYEFDVAQRFLDDFEVELDRKNPGASAVLTREDINPADLGRELRKKIPMIIARDFAPAASANVLEAQLEDIVVAMERAKEASLGVSSDAL